MHTVNHLSLKYLSNHCRALSLTPNFLSKTCSKMSWSTISNAELRSRSTRAEFFWFSIAQSKSFRILINAVWQLWPSCMHSDIHKLTLDQRQVNNMCVWLYEVIQMTFHYVCGMWSNSHDFVCNIFILHTLQFLTMDGKLVTP